MAEGDTVREASRGEAIARLADTPHILLNAPLVGQRLGYADVSGLDLLELFAFLHPARFAVPTVAGLARAVGVDPPSGDAAAAALLIRIAAKLLDVLDGPDWPERAQSSSINARRFALNSSSVRSPWDLSLCNSASLAAAASAADGGPKRLRST